MYQKFCYNCKTHFIVTGPAAKYCADCKVLKTQAQKIADAVRIAKSRAESGRIKKPGVGKGGNPAKGTSNPRYIHGKYVFETLRNEIKDERRYCERCKSDLNDVGRWHWVVHHKDHNHWNHDLSNLELLCKRCHQVEHECWHRFGTKAQRLSR